MRKRANIGWALLAVLLLVILLLNKWAILAPDIKPEIYLAPWREAQALSRAWRESPKLGEPNFNVGLFPVSAAIGVLQLLGLDANLSMRMLRWVLLLVGAWGAVRLYGFVVGDRVRRAGQVAMAVLYLANPYLVTAGDFLAIVLPAAMLPWLALFLLRATRSPGWRWPAAAALAFAAMSGMNAAVIPLIQLLCLPALIWYAHAGLGAPWRDVWAAFGRWATLALLLSAYWLVPSVAALGAGSHVTDFSESLAGIAAPSSFSEVIRGLGLWPLYGRDGDGPWQPGFTSYLTNPFVVAASFAMAVVLVVAALVVRGPARRLALLWAVPAIVLMVGVHPADSPTPFGRVLLWAFENVPGAAAFRTTNKVGAVLVLGVALIGSLATPALLRRARSVAPPPMIASGIVLVLVLCTWPAWTGGIFSLPLPVPDYWRRATATLDTGPQDQRVWFVPGVAQPQYTWSEDRPDDLNNALLARPSFVRLTLPESSPYGASLLAAVDTTLQEGMLPAGTLAAAARYLGVGDILVRNDVRWDKAGGARPATVDLQVRSDSGLVLTGSDGDPGEGVLRTAPQPPDELSLPPLQRYQVSKTRGTVRAEAVSGLVVVDGDGWAVAPLVHAGLLPEQPPYLLMGDLSGSGLAGVLGPDHRIVTTDTNRRRTVTPGRLTGAYGPLLAPTDDPGATIALFDADAQTVLRVQGGAVTATQVGLLFAPEAAGAPENAFDGEPSTAWRFGDFGRALGQSVTLHLDDPAEVDTITVDVPPTRGQRISRLRVQADDRAHEVAVPTDGRVRVGFPGATATTVRVTVTAVEGQGYNPVAIAEVAVPGVEVRRVARLPLSTGRAAGELDSAGLTALAATPLDVVLTRVQGTPGAQDDEEGRLDRDFSLADSRTYRVYGLVRPDAGASDALLDSLAGLTGDVAVSSSSRADNNVMLRGSRAFDADPSTAWAPGRAHVDEWVQATFPTRRVSTVTIEQPESATTWVSTAEIRLDGRVVASAQLQPGRVVVDVPTVRASELRVTVTGVSGTGVPRLSEIDVGAQVEFAPQRAAESCVPLGTVDGREVEVRVIGGVQGDGSRLVAGCTELELAAGEHELRAVAGWDADALVLRDRIGEKSVAGQAGPPLTVDRYSASQYRVSAPSTTKPYFLVVGQNLSPGWQARMDGADLGPPTLVDGYAMGWRIDETAAHEFSIQFAPQRSADVALAVSAAGLLLAAVLIALPLRHRPPSPSPTAAPISVAPPPVPTRRGDPQTRLGRYRARRRRLRWLGLVVGCWAFGGLPGLVAGTAVALWHAVDPPRARTLLRLAVGVMSLVPLAWIVGNLDVWGEVGPHLVMENTLPSSLVVLALVLLVVGAWREDSG